MLLIVNGIEFEEVFAVVIVVVAVGVVSLCS